MQLHSLFPTAVAVFDIGRPLNKTELDFFYNQKVRRSMWNTTSVDSEVLKNDSMLNIKTFIQESIDNFFNSIYSPSTFCRLRITQSWINYTEPGEHHHRHDHPNSFLSGVFYVNAERDKDSICFFKREFNQISINPNNFNLFNSDVWELPAETGKLILFPSSLSHMVEPTKSNTTRISLSFNTFIEGDVGNSHTLSGLRL